MVLQINGTNEYVRDIHDFSYLVEKYMGYEAKRFFDDAIRDYDDELEYVSGEAEEYKTKLRAYEN